MLYEIAITFAAPFIALGMLLSKRGRERLLQRFGFIKATGDFWAHGASVGEVKGLKPILNRLTKAPFITSISPTAKTSALLPFDSRVFLNPIFNQIKPKALIVSESDIWPVLINEAFKRNIPIFYVNARITEQAFNRINKSNLLSESLKKVKFFFCEDRNTESRLKLLGFNNISVEGNAKYEVASEPNISVLDFVKQSPSPFITLASIHPGEEKVLIPVLKETLREKILVVAPRHKERLEYFENILRREFEDVTLFSQGKWGRVLLIDTFGDLGTFLENSFLAVICGSFISGIGGHNPLEGKRVPTVIGPYHDKVSSVVLPDWVGADKIIKAVNDESFRERIKAELSSVYESQKGVSERVANAILEKL